MTDSRLVLASKSPRRRELLRQLDITYDCVAIDVDESLRDGESAIDFVRRLAMEKAHTGWQIQKTELARPTLGADTIVVVDGAILGKPRGKDDALRMMSILSGRTHQVMSAVAMVANDSALRLSISEVGMRSTTDAEREAYWDSGEPADKAGAYAIQGLAAMFVERLHGSYSGVMGLPLFETVDLLSRFSIYPPLMKPI
ncbi:MAG TPA: septum formation inhibitor Maf [Chromatiaceae bacterium]|nr:septum formation inhibitor Maf [Chromatiaceae bacterium]HIN81849.1 septum formation inhibitor Maf [Chromatiales bacterium]HIO14341.1 septum formation inhibitor Maf [Chromatiales bacterium]